MNIYTKYEYTLNIIIEVLQYERTIEIIHIFHKIQMQLEKKRFFKMALITQIDMKDDKKWRYNG